MTSHDYLPPNGNSIDIFQKSELVASILTNSKVTKIQSNPNFFTLLVGEEELIITADKIQIT